MNDTATKFCQSCGTQLPATATFCSNCGSAVGVAPAAAAPAAPAAPQMNYQQQAYAPAGKSKTPAVVLAVFLGFWSWLYTFKVNKTKFFIALGLNTLVSIVAIGFMVVLFQEMMPTYNSCLYQATYASECAAYAPTSSFSTFLISVASFPLWLWAVIDNARKPASFYQAYPNVK